MLLKQYLTVATKQGGIFSFSPSEVPVLFKVITKQGCCLITEIQCIVHGHTGAQNSNDTK